MDKETFNRGIVIPNHTSYGEARDMIHDLTKKGFPCDLSFVDVDANETLALLVFESKEKAVEAKLKYL